MKRFPGPGREHRLPGPHPKNALQDQTRGSFRMKRFALIPIVTVSMLTAAACSQEEAAKPAATAPATASAPAAAPAAAAPAAEGQLAKIPILPGYKYYVGGPVMKEDEYGRYRLTSFNGEVAQPPSRGMIFGAKLEGDQLEYKVWGNGILLGFHRGAMRNGVFWKTYGEAFRQGILVAKETIVNDDATKRSKITTQDIDPESGEVIRTKEISLSYLPMKVEEDEDADSDEGVAVPLPATKDAAPAAAPTAPAKTAPE